MNAAERIRAVLEKSEHVHRDTELPRADGQSAAAVPEPIPEPIEEKSPEPVETSLRLIFQTDDDRVVPVATAARALAEMAAEPPVQSDARAPVEAVPEPVIEEPVEEPVARLQEKPAEKSVEKRSPRPEAKPFETGAETLSERPVARPAAHEPKATEDADELEEALRVRRRHVPWTWIVLTGVLAVAALLAVIYRGVWLPQPAKTAAATGLQLSLESQDNGLISLRWNPASVPVREAREGRLRIVEEQKPPRTVPMNAAQLSAGHLFYESSAERVQFELEVVEKSGATVHETVIAGQKPEPAPVQAGEPTASTAAATTAPDASGSATAAVNPAAVPAATQPAPRAFTPPSLPKRTVAQEGRLTLLEPAPALSGGTTAAPVGALLPGKVDIIPPPPTVSGAATPPPPAQRVTVGGRLQAAMLLRKVAPVYPQLARSMRIQGVVRFEAVIGKNGAVRDLKFVSGPRALEQAASDAVKKWVYRPTMLDGRPVEVSTQIEINFTLGE